MNLIVTCARNLEGEAEEEIMDILDELGDPDVKISVSNMSGIITIQTKLDPIEVVRKMKEILLDEPWLFSFHRHHLFGQSYAFTWLFYLS